MDEYLTPVNDGQASDEGLQTEVENAQTVNADNAEATSGEQEQTETEGSKQTDTDAQATDEQKPRTQTKEENEQFAKVRKDAEAKVRAEIQQQQAIRDTEFAKRAAQFGWVDGNGNPIKTEEAYWKAVDDQAKMDALINSGKDPDAAKAIIERDELREKMAKLDQEFAEKARRDAENAEFFALFKEANGREFSIDDVVPVEIFTTAKENNIPLRFAYSDYLAKQAIAEKKNISLGKKTAEVNAQNAQSTSGSVNGSAQSDAITQAEISAHSDDIAWMTKNYKKVEEYYRKKG